MRRGRCYRLGQLGLLHLTALGANFLLQLPPHFILGTPLYVWGLLFNQLPASVLTVYALLRWVLPPLLRRQTAPFVGRLALWLPGSLLLTGLTRTGFDFGVAPRLLGQVPRQAFSWAEFLNPSSFTWFMVLITAGTAATIEVLQAWYRQQRRQERLRQRRLQAELELLKTRLQPAFLFGTLRALRGLTARRAAEAPAAVLHLADLLRYQLYESPLPTVPVADEVDMLRHYVALEQLRATRPVEVSLSFSGALAGHDMAPLLLLPLVENAFRHGTDARLDCAWVSLDLVVRHQTLTFKVINSRVARGPGAAGGEGLARLRRRLAHLYPDRHELKVLTDPDTYLAVLHLQLAPDPATPASPAGRRLPAAAHPSPLPAL